MKHSLLLSFLLLFAFILGCNDNETEGPSGADIQYLETAKVDTVDTYFGTEVKDPYRWLEDDNADSTKQWVKAQNKITNNYLQAIPFRSEIRAKVEELIDYERISAPSEHGDYYYYYKRPLIYLPGSGFVQFMGLNLKKMVNLSFSIAILVFLPKKSGN